MFLTFFQSNPLKKGWRLISSAPLNPSLASGVVTNFLIKFSASKDKFASKGIVKYCFHFTIFWQVSDGFSEKKGG